MKIKASAMATKREVDARSKNTQFDSLKAGTVAYKMLLMSTLFGFATATNAATFFYDGVTYIPLGLRVKSETVLHMPEKIKKYWPESENSINFNEIDDRTLSLSPAQENLEERLFIKGVSGQLYVAKVSTKTRYQPITEVANSKNQVYQADDGPIMRNDTLLFKLIRGELPAGFSSAPSSRELLSGPDYKIDAVEVWSSHKMTGIITQVTRLSPAGSKVKVNPAQIEIYIPEIGQLRLISMETYDLNDSTPVTKGYFVFSKS